MFLLQNLHTDQNEKKALLLNVVGLALVFGAAYFFQEYIFANSSPQPTLLTRLLVP